MTDIDEKELAIDCEKAEASIAFKEPQDIGYLAKLIVEEPDSYIAYALKPDGLQEYVKAMKVFN